MTAVYVVNQYKNNGWGSRIDNYDIHINTEVFSSRKGAIALVEGLLPNVAPNMHEGVTIFDGRFTKFTISEVELK